MITEQYEEIMDDLEYVPQSIPDTDHIMECLDKIAEISRSFGYVSCMDIFEQLAEIKTAIGR